MAGIFAVFKKKIFSETMVEKLDKCAAKLKHRGSKHTFYYENNLVKLVFHQNKAQRNNQPLNFSFNKENENFILIDGDIYNLYRLNQNYLKENYLKESDNFNLEGLLKGYSEIGPDVFNQVKGSFSGLLFDGNKLIGFKDPIGSKPLYYCDTDDFFIFSSELKALAPLSVNIKPVLPGSSISSINNLKTYFKYPLSFQENEITNFFVKKMVLKLNSLIKIAIADNIREGERVGVLLSGGLDSTIITHVAKKLVKNLYVYSIGIKNSRDVVYSKKFCKLNKLNLMVVEITLKEMIDCLSEVIYALETYDAALVRSAVPMFILSKRIHSKDEIDVLLTGEGGDELFGGYDNMDEFQSSQSLNQELLGLLKIEHITGLQRVDHIPYYFSIEARAPLFDRRIVEFSFQIPSKLKILKKKQIGTAKKWILRKAFESEIPSEFIWRRKQKFSEGAGSQFILRDHINRIISDDEFNRERQITPSTTLRSKEELYYWRIFRSKFNPTSGTISELGITNNFKT